jgi:dipeptidyl aminopeptidase/acylaminoacyl peptidase
MKSLALVLCLAVSSPLLAAPRLLTPDDIYNLKTVRDPQVSPDGRWVAYTVERLDRDEDGSDRDVWMVPMVPMVPMAPDAGGDPVRLTSSPEGESTPRFSPDGRYLAFLSSREGDKTQVWLLDRRGGEAVRLTDYKADVSDLAWSPDGKRLALVVSDIDPDEDQDRNADEKKKEKPKPIVIQRLQFKRDGEGYLREIRSHLYVFDVESKQSTQITSGAYDDGDPVWSPDGRLIAFSSNRTAPDPDANENSDVFVVAAQAGQSPRQVTTSPGGDGSPAFSPDGKLIAYVAGGDPADLWYGTSHIAVVPVAGGPSRPLTQALDRNVEDPLFSPDGKFVLFRLEDGGNEHLARVPVVGGAVERVVAGERDVEAFDIGPKGELAVLESSMQQPSEISAAALAVGGELRRLTHVNDAFLAGIRLAPVRRYKAKSADGTPIDAYLTVPPDAPQGQRLPTILRIHGGPTAQYSTGFQLEWQMFAAHGYAVVAANPRGSTGYGKDFSRAIWADWGNKDFQDVMAAVDEAVAMGVADPDRLGVGGWSYGGILTNYVIIQTGRFKAAVSGASEVNFLSNYGTDHYQYAWETELGLPWKNTDLWLKLSPWFRVEKVVTPTLFVCGGADVNVPCLNSEQFYQALRRLGRPTELVIYPGQTHSVRRPTFQKDRYERYLAWYDQYLRPEAGQGAAKAGR